MCPGVIWLRAALPPKLKTKIPYLFLHVFLKIIEGARDFFFLILTQEPNHYGFWKKKTKNREPLEYCLNKYTEGVLPNPYTPNLTYIYTLSQNKLPRKLSVQAPDTVSPVFIPPLSCRGRTEEENLNSDLGQPNSVWFSTSESPPLGGVGQETLSQGLLKTAGKHRYLYDTKVHSSGKIIVMKPR